MSTLRIKVKRKKEYGRKNMVKGVRGGFTALLVKRPSKLHMVQSFTVRKYHFKSGLWRLP